jgi:hypothetical protein
VSPGAGGAAGAPAPRVFICYRREESAAHAGRLYDAMVNRFGESNVFMDVDLAPGVDFVERITEVVAACQVLIVVMGRTWATVTDEEGDVRIADPEDFVRLEVETGLRRPDVTPIPVLVSGARMPRREDLPPELHAFTRRNALELSEARWRYDVGRLNSTLDELLTDLTRNRGTVATQPPAPRPSEEPPAPGPPEGRPTSARPGPPRPGPSDARLIFEGMLVGGATAFVARRLGNEIPDLAGTAGVIAEVMLRRAETWAIAGAALAVWLAIRTGRADFVRSGIRGLLVGAIAGAIGGAIWAVPVYLTDLSNAEFDVVNLEAANWIEVASLAVTAGLLGALIGALWRPPRPGAGMVSGAVAGALIQFIINEIGLVNPPDPRLALAFGLKGLAIAGLTLATLLALDRQRSAVGPVADVGATDP